MFTISLYNIPIFIKKYICEEKRGHNRKHTDKERCSQYTDVIFPFVKTCICKGKKKFKLEIAAVTTPFFIL